MNDIKYELEFKTKDIITKCRTVHRNIVEVTMIIDNSIETYLISKSAISTIVLSYQDKETLPYMLEIRLVNSSLCFFDSSDKESYEGAKKLYEWLIRD